MKENVTGRNLSESRKGITSRIPQRKTQTERKLDTNFAVVKMEILIKGLEDKFMEISEEEQKDECGVIKKKEAMRKLKDFPK